MAIKYLTNIDLSQNELLRARIENYSGNPKLDIIPGLEGQLIWSSTLDSLFVHNGTYWEPIDTVFSISAESGTNSAIFRITGSDGFTDDITFKGDSIISVSRAGSSLINITHGNNDGQLHVPATGVTNEGKFLKAGAVAGSIAWDEINLGTDTTGNFVAGIAAGTGVTVTNGSGEGVIPTIAIGQPVATTDDVTFAGATIGAITVGLTDNNKITTTAGSLTLSSADANVYVENNLLVQGNLTVNGTVTTINTETLNLSDNIIVLNSDEAGVPTQNAGFEVERGTSPNVSLIWNESTDRWTFTNDGTTYYNIPNPVDYTYIVDTSSFNGILSGSNSTIQSALNTIDDHNHDNRYYTETEINTMLDGLSSAAVDIVLSDIGNYYTIDNVEAALQQVGSALQNISGDAADISITDIGEYYDGANVELALQEIGLEIDGKANTIHTHIVSNVTGLQGALDAKAPITSPIFQGTVEAPNLNISTQFSLYGIEITADPLEINTLAGITASTTELNYTDGVTAPIQTQLNNKAPLASPALTGVPTAPTAVVNTNTTQVATTAFVNAEIANDAAPKVHIHTISDVTNLQTTLNGLQLTSEKGQANGYASLGADGLVPSTQLPSYVDDVLEFANLAAFPATGESGKIYVALDTNKTYRWSGSVYIYITSGAVDSVAGKTGVVSLVKGDVGLSNVDNTADIVKSVASAATLTTTRTLTIGSTGKTFNGSANVSWTLAEIGAQAAGSYAAAVHTHGTYDNSTALTGANVYSNVSITDGIVTGLTSRVLTASDIGAAKKASNEATATDGQVLTANGDGTFIFEAPTSTSVMSIFSEEFTATEGQTNFTLTTGSYSPGSSRLIIYIWGLRQHNTAFTETSSTTFALAAGVPAGTKILAEWRVADDTLKGDTGTAATIAVGTTTTGNAGTNASVVNAGTSSAALLNFTIPKGDQGIPGGNITTAAELPIVDAGTYFAATNVEAALAEIATTKAPTASPTFTGTVTVATRIDFGTAASIVYNSATKSFDFIINE